MGVKRREVLAWAAAGAIGAAPAEPDWRALAEGLHGKLHRPGTTRLHDPRFDGVHPPAVVECGVAEDAAEAVLFARRHGMGVVAKGGGHSYVGASTSSEALVIDTSRLNEVTYDAGTATIGAGAQLLPVSEQLARHGVSVALGSCGTVGVSGLTLGGGLGMAARRYGLTCDSALELDLVTCAGTHQTVSADREPDLFWACRGGGGGQVGVVTSWRLRTFPIGDVGSFVLRWPWRLALRVAAAWQARSWAEEVWCTLQFAADRSVRMAGFVLGGEAQPEVDALIASVGTDPERVEVDRRPYLEVVRDRAGSGRRATHLIGSDVIGGPLPEALVAQALSIVAQGVGSLKFSSLTGAISRPAPDATAFAWRRSFALLQWLAVDGDPEPSYAWIRAGHQAVASASIGRYVNYLEPDAELLARYYGPNLDRLRRVRAAADPDRVLRTRFAV